MSTVLPVDVRSVALSWANHQAKLSSVSETGFTPGVTKFGHASALSPLQEDELKVAAHYYQLFAQHTAAVANSAKLYSGPTAALIGKVPKMLFEDINRRLVQGGQSPMAWPQFVNPAITVEDGYKDFQKLFARQSQHSSETITPPLGLFKTLGAVSALAAMVVGGVMAVYYVIRRLATGVSGQKPV